MNFNIPTLQLNRRNFNGHALKKQSMAPKLKDETNSIKANSAKSILLAGLIAVGTAGTLAILAKKGKLGESAKSFMDKIFKQNTSKLATNNISNKTSGFKNTNTNNVVELSENITPVTAVKSTKVPKLTVRPNTILADVKSVDKYLSEHPDSYKKIENVFKETKMSGNMVTTIPKGPNATWYNMILDSIYDSKVSPRRTLYFETTPKEKALILKNGLSPSNIQGFFPEGRYPFKLSKPEAGYQTAIIKTKLAYGSKLARVDFLTMCDNTLVGLAKGLDADINSALRKTFGLSAKDPLDVGSVVDNYYVKKLISMGYDGVETNHTVRIFDTDKIQIKSKR